MVKKFFEDWKILKRGKRIDFAIIIAITAVFLSVVFMNVYLIFCTLSDQTESIGQTQLEVIRGDFQGTISSAEGATLRMALAAEQMIKSGASRDELKEFFYTRKREQKNLTDGVCFNVYIAGKDWTIIPDFAIPPEYRAPERLWYKGAMENPGQVYISEPYIDAMSGIMCYTMSKMLSDGETVVALDFNFSDVQQSILKMSKTGDRTALIVTKDGMIIGYNDMGLVGQTVSAKLPDYAEILSRVTENKRHDTFTAQLSDGEYTIFSAETSNGWHMILSVKNQGFYEESYQRMLITIVSSLLMMLAIIFFYLKSMKNRLQAQTALRVKEEFLSGLSHKLRDPLRKILDASSISVTQSATNPAEKAAEVRESALKLSDMLENLFSLSTIVSSSEKNSSAEKIFQDEKLSKVSDRARFGIISVLVIAMVLCWGICVTTTIGWGDSDMNREVAIHENQLNEWIEHQRAVLSMFVNLLKEHPELMDDYLAAVKFLDDIAKHYPEISVCYLSNPHKEHCVIMNNGWQPPEEFRPETRPWYIETEHSVAGFSISPPYYDAQTGLYCITMAQLVFTDNNEFVGIFAIDFYIDRLTQVLGATYGNDKYAFLVDRNGIIINHPNSDYQLSKNQMTDIADTEYSDVYELSGVKTLRDYTGNFVACLAKRNVLSNFTVIVASDWWRIYGNVVILGAIFIFLLCISVGIVSGLINRLFSWQKAVNRQLKDASDTAVAASRAKSQFLAQMSHEIRTPINAILGMNEMILRENKSAEISDYSMNIQSAGRTLLTLINSILDFSKIEDGKMEIIPVRYDTSSLIDNLINMISERAAKKNLEFNTEIDPDLPKSLYGDDVRLRQVITNLLTNAVKYTPKGSVTLSIGGREIDSDTFELTVKVSDTGIGIRAEDMDKLFKSFQRIDEERNRNIEGTGLGITIVQKLLDMMESHLEVSSVYGEGSEFSFTLRQKIIDKSPIGKYDVHSHKHSENLPEKKFITAAGAKVLAVDDNEMNLKVIRALLKRNKIFPDVAERGQEAIELAKKNFYHIIFLDNMMPGMNGVETFKKMQDEKILSDKTAVVMLTASARAGMREIYLREGFDDYLSKPIEVSELETVLERHLPKELVSFVVEGKEASPVQKNITETKSPVEVDDVDDDVAGEDEFSKRERKIFNETCPDLDLDSALQYSMDSKEFLIEILDTFRDDEKSEKIQEAFDSRDVKNYQILVHALKSTALLVGAEKLSMEAKNLELAAKENDVEKILAGHAALMEHYKKIREQITAWLRKDNA